MLTCNGTPVTSLFLLKRTREAVSVLRDEYQKKFRPVEVQKLDRVKGRLIGKDGYFIQWTDSGHTFGRCTLGRDIPAPVALAQRIKNIRYGEIRKGRGTIDFDFDGTVLTITEPTDVILVGCEGAPKWIVENYGFLLANC